MAPNWRVTAPGCPDRLSCRELNLSVGSVPARYSSQLLAPSWSLSRLRSVELLALNPKAVSQTSGMPSASLSARVLTKNETTTQLVLARLRTTRRQVWLVTKLVGAVSVTKCTGENTTLLALVSEICRHS